MEPAFNTPRLEVLKATVKLDRERHYYIGEKVVYLAFRTDDDTAYPVCVCTVDEAFGVRDWDWVEWIETISDLRRQGFARELCEGIEKHRGVILEMTGATEEGAAFVDAMGQD